MNRSDNRAVSEIALLCRVRRAFTCHYLPMALHEDRRRIGVRLSVLQYALIVALYRAGGQLLGAAGRAAREVRGDGREQPSSGRCRCARRAASCSIATAASSSRTVTPSASRSFASTPRISITRSMCSPSAGRRRSARARDRRPAPARADLPADHDRAGRDAGAGRRPSRAPTRLRAARRDGRGSADAPVSRARWPRICSAMSVR